MPWKPSVKASSTSVIENKREKGSNRHVSGGLVWSLSRLRVTQLFVHLRRTTANWVRRTLAGASPTAKGPK
jgi:hypothetical protein